MDTVENSVNFVLKRVQFCSDYGRLTPSKWSSRVKVREQRILGVMGLYSFCVFVCVQTNCPGKLTERLYAIPNVTWSGFCLHWNFKCMHQTCVPMFWTITPEAQTNPNDDMLALVLFSPANEISILVEQFSSWNCPQQCIRKLNEIGAHCT